jgi:hypothetical protein
MAHHKPEQLKSLLRQSASQGVDVIFDPVGGSLLMESLKTARWGAHILIIGFASGTIPKLPANLLLVKNLTAHGIYWCVASTLPSCTVSRFDVSALPLMPLSVLLLQPFLVLRAGGHS